MPSLDLSRYNSVGFVAGALYGLLKQPATEGENQGANAVGYGLFGYLLGSLLSPGLKRKTAPKEGEEGRGRGIPRRWAGAYAGPYMSSGPGPPQAVWNPRKRRQGLEAGADDALSLLDNPRGRARSRSSSRSLHACIGCGKVPAPYPVYTPDGHLIGYRCDRCHRLAHGHRRNPFYLIDERPDEEVVIDQFATVKSRDEYMRGFPNRKFVVATKKEAERRYATYAPGTRLWVTHRERSLWADPRGRNPVSKAAQLYQAFHGAPPACQRRVHLPTPKGPLMQVGRVIDIVYEPERPSTLAGKQFEHEFGDTGLPWFDRDIKKRPLLATDGKDLYLVRDRSPHYFSERGIIA